LPQRTATLAAATFFLHMTAGLGIVTKFGHFDHDAAMTMAAVLVGVVLMAYWILKT
jgi:ABC-type sulfate transport system permease component